MARFIFALVVAAVSLAGRAEGYPDRPVRMIVFTGRSWSSHRYMIRTSIFVGPAGVSITGRKSTRS